MKFPLSSFKYYWNKALKIGAYIIPLVASLFFIPEFEHFDTFKVSALPSFISFSICLLIWIPLLRYNKKKDWRKWRLTGIIYFVLFFILSVAYIKTYHEHTFKTDTSTLIIGTEQEFIPAARKQTEVLEAQFHRTYSISELLKDNANNELEFWSQETLNTYYYTLVALFVGSVAALTLSIICTIQAIICFQKPNARSRS